MITSVNLAEVATQLLREAFTPDEVRTLLPEMPLSVIPVEEKLAYQAAPYDNYTRKFGLSLGDRVCLAAGWATGYTVLTADKTWKKINLDNVTIKLIR